MTQNKQGVFFIGLANVNTSVHMHPHHTERVSVHVCCLYSCYTMLSGVFDVPVNSLILGVIILFLGAWLLNKRKRIGGLRAPGPRPWPILGNALLLAREPNLAHQVMKRLAKQYGPVMSLQIGSNSMVVLSDLNAAKEAFIKKADVFNFRPQWLPLNKYFEDNDYPGYGMYIYM